MTSHTITPAVGAVCRCKAKAGLRCSPRRLLTRTRIVITAEIKSGFVAKDDLVSFLGNQVSSCVADSKRRCRWAGVKDNTRIGCRDPECPSARRLHMVREDTGKVLSVPGWWPMKQLAVRVHFL
ncbi:uncharacterized protein TNCV_3301791 [Trichonephila clavipes]|nr:uncharacterized protein TNCV_3301791 [Trichonephila clavipes]